MEYDTAGDPISGLKWTRKTTEKIAVELRSIGIAVCGNTVGKLLKNMDYSLRVNYKTIERTTSVTDKDRDRQFQYIRQVREEFKNKACPSISVDTKKRELVGNFKNAGVSWEREPIRVNDHDFRSQAKGVAIPYGVYDIQANHGFVCVGNTYDTSTFAVDSIVEWWLEEGQGRYQSSEEILILADSGGSNSARCRLWKFDLQKKLCNPFGMTVTVCHYPPGSSKWNPIEHRLFSMISNNWAGKPLTSYENILKYIKTSKTITGLRVKAKLIEKEYVKGKKVTDAQMNEIQLTPHSVFPQWNYSISPKKCEINF